MSISFSAGRALTGWGTMMASLVTGATVLASEEAKNGALCRTGGGAYCLWHSHLPHHHHCHLVIGLGTRGISVLIPCPCNNHWMTPPSPAPSLPHHQVLTFLVLPGCSASQACTMFFSSSILSVSLLTSKCSLS